MKHSAPIFVLMLMMAVGCKPKVPSEYVQPGELEDMLYEYHVA